MPRLARIAPGGMVFHTLNRGVGRMELFGKDADYRAFEEVLEMTVLACSMRLCAYCLMPNHWHLLLWPKEDGDLASFMQRLTITHATRWQTYRHRIGTGHLYQGRYKSFPVQTDNHFYQVVRYVERNALRANLVKQAEDWRWSSLWRRLYGTSQQKTLLCAWPVTIPRAWTTMVNEPQSSLEEEQLCRCIQRGQPFGGEQWVEHMVKKLGLISTVRPRGRPRKKGPVPFL